MLESKNYLKRNANCFTNSFVLLTFILPSEISVHPISPESAQKMGSKRRKSDHPQRGAMSPPKFVEAKSFQSPMEGIQSPETASGSEDTERSDPPQVDSTSSEKRTDAFVLGSPRRCRQNGVKKEISINSAQRRASGMETRNIKQEQFPRLSESPSTSDNTPESESAMECRQMPTLEIIKGDVIADRRDPSTFVTQSERNEGVGDTEESVDGTNGQMPSSSTGSEEVDNEGMGTVQEDGGEANAVLPTPATTSTLSTEVPATTSTLSTKVPATTSTLSTEVPATTSTLSTEVPATTSTLSTEVPATTSTLSTEVPATTSTLSTEVPATTSTPSAEVKESTRVQKPTSSNGNEARRRSTPSSSKAKAKGRRMIKEGGESRAVKASSIPQAETVDQGEKTTTGDGNETNTPLPTSAMECGPNNDKVQPGVEIYDRTEQAMSTSSGGTTEARVYYEDESRINNFSVEREVACAISLLMTRMQELARVKHGKGTNLQNFHLSLATTCIYLS